jgi:hypothetical protein
MKQMLSENMVEHIPAYLKVLANYQDKLEKKMVLSGI